MSDEAACLSLHSAWLAKLAAQPPSLCSHVLLHRACHNSSHTVIQAASSLPTACTESPHAVTSGCLVSLHSWSVTAALDNPPAARPACPASYHESRHLAWCLCTASRSRHCKSLNSPTSDKLQACLRPALPAWHHTASGLPCRPASGTTLPHAATHHLPGVLVQLGTHHCAVHALRNPLPQLPVTSQPARPTSPI